MNGAPDRPLQQSRFRFNAANVFNFISFRNISFTPRWTECKRSNFLVPPYSFLVLSGAAADSHDEHNNVFFIHLYGRTWSTRTFATAPRIILGKTIVFDKTKYVFVGPVNLALTTCVRLSIIFLTRLANKFAWRLYYI